MKKFFDWLVAFFKAFHHEITTVPNSGTTVPNSGTIPPAPPAPPVDLPNVPPGVATPLPPSRPMTTAEIMALSNRQYVEEGGIKPVGNSDLSGFETLTVCGQIRANPLVPGQSYLYTFLAPDSGKYRWQCSTRGGELSKIKNTTVNGLTRAVQETRYDAFSAVKGELIYMTLEVDGAVNMGVEVQPM